MGGWGAARALRDRRARLHLTGVLVSGFGDSAMSLAAGIWIKTLTGSSALAALAGLCAWGPMLAGPVLGTLADRMPRRRLLVTVDLLLAGVLTAPLALHTLQPAALVAVLFGVLTLIGAGSVLTDAAEVALVPAVVPEERRGDFNGLVRTAVESTKLLAPLAGAGLFTVCGGPAVALLDTASFALAAAAFAALRIREPAPQRRQSGSWTADTAAGMRHIARRPLLRALVPGAGVAMLASSLGSTATYALLDDGLHLPPAYAGVLTPVQGAGSIVSGLAAGALARRTSGRTFAAAGLLVFALGLLARTAPSLPLVLAGSLAIGLGLPCPLIAALNAVQRETPGELLGRAAATANTLTFAPAGLGQLLGGAAVAALDYRVQTAAAAALALAAAIGLVRGGSRGRHPHGAYGLDRGDGPDRGECAGAAGSAATYAEERAEGEAAGEDPSAPGDSAAPSR